MKKIVAIGGEDFALGFSMVGCEGYIEEDPKKVLQIIKDLINKGDTGLIFLEESIAEPISKELREIKLKTSVPIIYNVPGPNSVKKVEDYRKLVRQILGV